MHLLILNCFVRAFVFTFVAFISTCSVVSGSLRLHGLYPARLLCLWELPGKNSRQGCHFLLQGIFPTTGLNLWLTYLQVDSLPLIHLGCFHNKSQFRLSLWQSCQCFGCFGAKHHHMPSRAFITSFFSRFPFPFPRLRYLPIFAFVSGPKQIKSHFFLGAFLGLVNLNHFTFFDV